jgi:hypothetical protein
MPLNESNLSGTFIIWYDVNIFQEHLLYKVGYTCNNKAAMNFGIMSWNSAVLNTFCTFNTALVFT